MNRENYDAYQPLIDQGGDALDIIECIENNVVDQPEIIAGLLRDAFQQGYVPSRNVLRYCVRRVSLEKLALICSVDVDELSRILYSEKQSP